MRKRGGVEMRVDREEEMQIFFSACPASWLQEVDYQQMA